MPISVKQNRFLVSIIEIIIRLRVPIIIALSALVIIAAYYSTKIEINNSLDVWFVQSDPALQRYKNFQKQFGNDETIAVVFSDSISIFTSENKDLIRNLTADITTVPSVEKVYSVIDAVKEEYFVSNNRKTTILYIVLETIENIDKERGQIIRNVEHVLKKHFTPSGRKYYLAGAGIVHEALNQITLEDSSLFIFLSYILIIALLAVFIRKIEYILLAAVTIICSVVLTMGLFSVIGRSLNMFTTIVPTIIIIFGVADMVHIIHAYFRYARKYPDLSKIKTVINSISSVTIPCFLTSLTTAVGFASLTISSLSVVKDFGIIITIGIIVTFCLSIVTSSIAFSLFRYPKLKRVVRRKPGFLGIIIKTIHHHKHLILFASLSVFIIAVFGILRIKVDTYSIQFLKPQHKIRQDNDYIEKNFGFYVPMEFTIHGERNSFVTLRNLKKVDQIQKIIEQQRYTASTYSFLNFLPDLSILLSRFHVLQMMQFLPRSELRRFISPDYSTMRITCRTKMLSASGYKEVIDNIIAETKEICGDDIILRPDGYIPIYVKMIDYITKTQLVSFSLTFVIVIAIISLYAGSFKLSIISILPNLLPLAITLGIMGWFNIRLDIATVTITAIAIGVIVDDTMHFLYRFKKEAANSTVEEAVESTIRKVGVPIILTSVILILGFLVIMLAQVHSISQFGFLSAILIGSALFGDIFILPALLLSLKNKKIVEK